MTHDSHALDGRLQVFLPFFGRRLRALDLGRSQVLLEFENGALRLQAPSFSVHGTIAIRSTLFEIEWTSTQLLVLRTSSGSFTISSTDEILPETVGLVEENHFVRVSEAFKACWGGGPSSSHKNVWMGRRAPKEMEHYVVRDPSTAVTRMDSQGPFLILGSEISDPMPFILRWWANHRTEPVLGLWLERVVDLPEDLDMDLHTVL